MTEGRNMRTIATKVPQETADELRALAFMQQTTVSDLLGQALEAYMGKLSRSTRQKAKELAALAQDGRKP